MPPGCMHTKHSCIAGIGMLGDAMVLQHHSGWGAAGLQLQDDSKVAYPDLDCSTWIHLETASGRPNPPSGPTIASL